MALSASGTLTPAIVRAAAVFGAHVLGHEGVHQEQISRGVASCSSKFCCCRFLTSLRPTAPTWPPRYHSGRVIPRYRSKNYISLITFSGMLIVYSANDHVTPIKLHEVVVQKDSYILVQSKMYWTAQLRGTILQDHDQEKSIEMPTPYGRRSYSFRSSGCAGVEGPGLEGVPSCSFCSRESTAGASDALEEKGRRNHQNFDLAGREGG